jgi:hypothetical protein
VRDGLIKVCRAGRVRAKGRRISYRETSGRLQVVSGRANQIEPGRLKFEQEIAEAPEDIPPQCWAGHMQLWQTADGIIRLGGSEVWTGITKDEELYLICAWAHVQFSLADLQDLVAQGVKALAEERHAAATAIPTEASSNALLRPAPTEEIRNVLTAVYDEAPAKPPNVREVVKPAQAKLAAKGLRASRGQIQTVADEPQFKSRRGLVGKRYYRK